MKTGKFLAAACLSATLAGCAVSPKMLTSAEQAALSKADMEAIFGEQQAVSGPLSLYDAMARAVLYNLEHRVQMMEQVLATDRLKVARSGMLPQLVANAGYSSRSNKLGSSSTSLLTGTESLEPSTSQDRDLDTANVSLVWNFLDLGVSHAMAKQQADEVLIAQEKRRKVVQNIIQDVRYAYWRAVSAQRLLADMDGLGNDLNRALERSTRLQKSGAESPQQQLKYRKSLLQMAQRMWEVRKELATAEAELAALINLPPGQKLQLADADLSIPRIKLQTRNLENFALLQRPELREEHYRSRISSEEIRKATLRMLPGVEASLGQYHDGNSYAWRSNWSQFGINLSWNLFNLWNGQKEKALAESGHELDKIRRYAMSMAVMAQVNLAKIRFDVAQQDYGLSRALLNVEHGLEKHARAAQQADSSNDLNVFKSRAQLLLARMNHLSSYAELQNAMGRVLHSLGIDPVSEDVNDDAATLAAQIKERMTTWRDRVAAG
ncbi:MAG: TolC family protein [Halieaceae bacterium]|nr:TolC family protein [Halieaceae bacterium]